MASIVSATASYIEISSDSDSSDEEEKSTGLDSCTVVVKLFEQFLLKCTLYGVRDDDIQRIRNIFQNVSIQFLQTFVPFLRNALVKVNKENAMQMITDVGQCLCTEETAVCIENGQKSRGITESYGEKSKTQRFHGSFDDAKKKIIEFINSQTRGNDNNERSGHFHAKHGKESPFNSIRCKTPHFESKREHNVIDSQNSLVLQGHDHIVPINDCEKAPPERRDDSNLIGGGSQIQKKQKTDEDALSSAIGKEKCKNLRGNENGDGNDSDDDVVIVSVINHVQNPVVSTPSLLSTQNVSSAQPCGNSKATPKEYCQEAKEHKRQLLIKSIKKKLQFYDKEIKKLMEAEITLEEMDSPDSSYIKESKLKAKYSNLYKKLSKLQGSRGFDENLIYATIRIEGCPYPEVNREAEVYVRRKMRFPDFFDVKNVVSSANKNYKLGLKATEETDIAREVFSEIGDKLQRKRKREFVRYSGSHLTDNVNQLEDPAIMDERLKQKLKKNKRISKLNTEKMFKHYTRLQYEGCDTNAVSTDDEEIEKTVLKAQKKINPMRIKAFSATSTIHQMDEESQEASLSKPESQDCSSNTTEISRNMDTGSNELLKAEVKMSNWDGNSCIPKKPILTTVSTYESRTPTFVDKKETSSSSILNEIRTENKSMKSNEDATVDDPHIFDRDVSINCQSDISSNCGGIDKKDMLRNFKKDTNAVIVIDSDDD